MWDVCVCVLAYSDASLPPRSLQSEAIRSMLVVAISLSSCCLSGYLMRSWEWEVNYYSSPHMSYSLNSLKGAGAHIGDYYS